MGEAATDTLDAVEIAPRVWWVGGASGPGGLQNNVYLIEQGNESVLIDPGSGKDFDETIRKIESVVGISSIRWVICSQPDIDKVMALSRFVEKGLHFDATIVTDWRTQAALRRTGIALPLRDVNDHHRSLALQDRSLRFLPTPYLSVAGAFCTVDEMTGTLFSSDLFGSFEASGPLFMEENESFDSIREFHEYIVPSRDVLTRALHQVRSATVRIIAPQHGQLIPESLVPRVTAALDDLECGVLLLAQSDPGLSFLFAANRTIHGVINAMVKEQHFSKVAAYLAGLAKKTLDADYFELWAAAGDVTFQFDTSDDFAGHLSDPPDDVVQVLKGKEVDPGRRLLLSLRSPATGAIDGVMVWGFRERRIPSDATIAVLRQIISLVDVGLEREILRRSTDLELSEWHIRAIHDPLTGLRNRASLVDSYHQLSSFDDRNPSPQMAALMVDIDHFKVINDTFGHAVGDVVIQRIAHAIVQCVRPSDPSFRLGGEEFLILMSNVDEVSALKTAERIRERVADAGRDVPIVTVSVGIARRHEFEDQDSLLARADHALYVAKGNGRDRVEFAP